MSSELGTLVDLIATQVRLIEQLCAHQNTAIPRIDEPKNNPGVLRDPACVQAADIAISAALRLVSSLLDPHTALLRVATGMYGSALLNVVVEANITEALREAGPQGLHINDLGSRVGIEPSLLGRVLRYLCAMHHLYREVSPDVFSNNKLSTALDTGKTFDEVKDRGPLRYAHSKGIAAIIGHTTDDCLKGAPYLSGVILESDPMGTKDATQSAVMKAVGFDGDYFKWVEEDVNVDKKRLHRFGVAMKNMENVFPKELVVSRYPWDTLPKEGLVVDVGGGIGGNTLPLAQTFPNLRFIIQDRPQVIVDAERHWKEVFPQALESGLVRLQSHSFFEPQPVKNASAFVLRFILHDWPVAECITILQHLRAASASDTKLIILEPIVPYACPVNKGSLMKSEQIPEVLQGNLAPSGGFSYYADIQMMNILNAQQRSAEEWVELAQAGGFKVEHINPGILCAIVCTPA